MRVVFRALPPNAVNSPIALPVGTVSGTWLYTSKRGVQVTGNGVEVEHDGQVVVHVSRSTCFTLAMFPIGRGGVKTHLSAEVARGSWGHVF